MNTIPVMVARIHDSPHQAVVSVSGAGSQAVTWLLGIPGASRTLLEVLVPYGTGAMLEFLGFEPVQFVSEGTARSMARAAYRRARRFADRDVPLLGLGCTATIATDRTKRGKHSCYIATWDDSQWIAYNLLLDKGRRDRSGEEGVVSKLVLQALAKACGIKEDLELDLTSADAIETHHNPHPDPLEALVTGEAGTVTVKPDGHMTVDDQVGGALLPGSFNPLHRGHEALAQVASEILGTEVVFEISITNVDKPTLTAGEVRHRLSQLHSKATVVLTRADTYQKKAALFPRCTFVIGWDTAARLVAPSYYGGDESTMLAALVDVWGSGCRFLVAGRESGGEYRTLSDVPIPRGFKPLFQSIPESAFRMDISSTSLRAQI